MVTIVEYSPHKRAINAYPTKIISPTSPGPCCLSSTEQLGGTYEDNGWPFVYRRCAVCGFTVRRFASRNGLLEERRVWRKQGGAISAPDAA
jgi:hypothetical protein